MGFVGFEMQFREQARLGETSESNFVTEEAERGEQKDDDAEHIHTRQSRENYCEKNISWGKMEEGGMINHTAWLSLYDDDLSELSSFDPRRSRSALRLSNS